VEYKQLAEQSWTFALVHHHEATTQYVSTSINIIKPVKTEYTFSRISPRSLTLPIFVVLQEVYG